MFSFDAFKDAITITDDTGSSQIISEGEYIQSFTHGDTTFTNSKGVSVKVSEDVARRIIIHNDDIILDGKIISDPICEF